MLHDGRSLYRLTLPLTRPRFSLGHPLPGGEGGTRGAGG